MTNLLPLSLGLIIFSFTITSILIIPFINILYKLKLLRKKEGGRKAISLFDKLHDVKAGTPVGGGILIVLVVCFLFALLLPFFARMGVYIRSAFDFKVEIFIIFFTFLSFWLLGLSDDIIKIFGKPQKGKLGYLYGLSRKQKFLIEWVLGLFIGYLLSEKLGIKILHLPLIDQTVYLGNFYILLSAFIIVFFSNAFNITDGLDGLATGILLIFLFAFAAISSSNLDTPLSVFITIWIGSLMAFLYFNVWPARIFLGDAGALAFGAMIAVIGLLTGSVVALFVIGGLFVVELVSAAIQIFGWKFLNRPILPLAPIHNTLLVKGWEEPKIVIRSWLAGLILAIFGLWLASI